MKIGVFEKPYIIFWELTRACLLACKHCRAKAQKYRNPNELSVDECRDTLRDLAKWGVKPIIVITGGDPLMREDLIDIIELINKFGMRVAIAFSTTKLATKEKLEEIKNAGISRAAISLDGSTAKLHDSFRGVKGTYDLALKIIELCKDLEIPIQVNTTVTKENIFDLPNILKLCIKKEVKFWDVFFLVPTGRADVSLMPNAREFEDILNWLYDVSVRLPIKVKSSAATHLRRIEIMRKAGIYRIKPGELYYELMKMTKFDSFRERKSSEDLGDIKRMFGVTDGRGMFFISHVGEVYPSGFLPLVAGNVRESSIREIYEKSEIFKNLRDPEKLRGKCGRCPFKYVCGGSRARAYAVFGDYLAQEPCCLFSPENDLKSDDLETLQNFLNFS